MYTVTYVHPLSSCAFVYYTSVQSLSHVWLFVTPWTAAMPGFPVRHQLWEFTQTHVHRVGDAIQPSHPLLSPSPPAFNLSQHQDLFQWEESALPIRGPKCWSFSFGISLSSIQNWFPLGLTDLISLLSKGLSKFSSSTTAQKHQFFGAQPSLWSNSHIHTWLLEKPELWLYRPWLAK